MITESFPVDRERLEAALTAAERPMVLTGAAQLARAEKAWRRAPLLAVDTEFVRERTYYADLGLVQISDGQTVWLIDPLGDGELAPLRRLLADQNITKLLHSPSEDLEVLQYVTGELPAPMVDSQLACSLLGQPLQLGYHKAAEWLLNVPIDKDLTRSNWLARPLRPELLRYAALDVCVLPMMWDLLRGRLEQLGRLSWLQEDCQRALETARASDTGPERWRRIKGIGRLGGSELAVLQALTAWREEEAERRNRPRGFIVPDPVLLAIASERITSTSGLAALDGLHPRVRQRHGQRLTQLVESTLTAGRALSVPPQAGPRERALLKELRSVVAAAAERLALDPTVLAAKRDLEALLFHRDPDWLPERLRGWRRAEVGEALLAHKASFS